MSDNNKKYNIAVIPGDGIGPEVMDAGLHVLTRIAEKFGCDFKTTKVLAGGAAIDATGKCLPQETVDICKASDAVLLAAVGGPKWNDLPGDERPEKALLELRKLLGLYANLRPAMVFPQLADASPLKAEIISGGLDILVVRELTGGIYFGKKGTEKTEFGLAAYDVEQYSEMEVERIAKTAFSLAEKRNKNVISVDKSNVLESSRLWRRVVEALSPKIILILPSTICMWITPQCSLCETQNSLTYCSQATFLATYCLTKQAKLQDPSACCRRQALQTAISVCMNLCTAQHLILRDVTSPILSQ